MLTGRNIILRALEPGDIDSLYKWENNAETWRVSNTVSPFSRYILNQYVTSVKDIFSEKQLRLMIDLSGHSLEGSRQRAPGVTSIGCIDLFEFDPHHQRAGVGILIAEKDHRGKGHASEALGLLIEYAFGTLGLHQLFCNIQADNTVSLKLFQKHNFQLIGNKKQWIKDGSNKWIDEFLLQLIFP